MTEAQDSSKDTQDQKMQDFENSTEMGCMEDREHNMNIETEN